MPYVIKASRKALDAGECPMGAGELNYALTAKVLQYVKELGITYQIINDVVGALEGAKLEFYRRVAVPYENEKMRKNGDVYKALKS